MRLSAALLFAALATTAIPSLAQTEIRVPVANGWKHANTGLIFRPQISQLNRQVIEDLSETELDVSLQYRDSTTLVSIYVFRPAVMSVPVWFDRAEALIVQFGQFAGAVPEGPAAAFAPPHAGVRSALRRTYAPVNGVAKSTAQAMLPMGEWLVAFRMSSDSLDSAQLNARLDSVIAAINWPTGVKDGPAASIVTPCAKPLAYASRARMRAPDLTQALIGATMASAAGTLVEKEGEVATPPVYCREGAQLKDFGVYRDPSRRKSYLMALGDAGRVIHVAPTVDLLGNGGGYQVSFAHLDRTLVYPIFTALPLPAAALQATRTVAPMSSKTRDGKGVTIGM